MLDCRKVSTVDAETVRRAQAGGWTWVEGGTSCFSPRYLPAPFAASRVTQRGREFEQLCADLGAGERLGGMAAHREINVPPGAPGQLTPKA